MNHIGLIAGVFVANGICSLLAITLLTRYLQPIDYGLLGVAISGGALINAVFFQWIRVCLLRYMPSTTSVYANAKLTRLIFALYTLTASLIVLLLVIAVSIFGFGFKISSVYIWCFCFVGLTQGAYEILLADRGSRELTREFAAYSIMRSILWVF